MPKAKRNMRQRMDGLELLGQVPDREAALAFFDPQYRQVLDKMDYGNEGDRQKERAELPQMDDRICKRMLAEIERALRPMGHAGLWVDKFGLVSGHWRRWLPDVTSLAPVDMVTWNKDRIGMGRRFRCQTEFMIVLQKGPLRADGVWTDHQTGDTWTEKADRKRHPHAKPVALTGKVIAACTNSGDLVIDPCAGGYGTLDACRVLARDFLGCDLV